MKAHRPGVHISASHPWRERATHTSIDSSNSALLCRTAASESREAMLLVDTGTDTPLPRRNGECAAATAGWPEPVSSDCSLRAIAFERKPATSSGLRLSRSRALHGEGGPGVPASVWASLMLLRGQAPQCAIILNRRTVVFVFSSVEATHKYLGTCLKSQPGHRQTLSQR